MGIIGWKRTIFAKTNGKKEIQKRHAQKPPDLNVSELHASPESCGARKTTNSPGDKQTLINVK